MEINNFAKGRITEDKQKLCNVPRNTFCLGIYPLEHIPLLKGGGIVSSLSGALSAILCAYRRIGILSAIALVTIILDFCIIGVLRVQKDNFSQE